LSVKEFRRPEPVEQPLAHWTVRAARTPCMSARPHRFAGAMAARTPGWLLRLIVDALSVSESSVAEHRPWVSARGGPAVPWNSRAVGARCRGNSNIASCSPTVKSRNCPAPYSQHDCYEILASRRRRSRVSRGARPRRPGKQGSRGGGRRW
jgi:hypothetical protein